MSKYMLHVWKKAWINDHCYNTNTVLDYVFQGLNKMYLKGGKKYNEMECWYGAIKSVKIFHTHICRIDSHSLENTYINLQCFYTTLECFDVLKKIDNGLEFNYKSKQIMLH